MSAIEKICEYSGDYPGWLMYGYKRDHIQIMPEYRKDFRGKKAVLYIQTDECVLGRYLVTHGKHGGWHLTEAVYKERIVKCGNKYYDLEQSRGRSWYPVHVYKEHWYALVVPDMPGEVDGIYINHSNNISAVKRKLKRMLRCRDLEVRYIDKVTNIKHLENLNIV